MRRQFITECYLGKGHAERPKFQPQGSADSKVLIVVHPICPQDNRITRDIIRTASHEAQARGDAIPSGAQEQEKPDPDRSPREEQTRARKTCRSNSAIVHRVGAWQALHDQPPPKSSTTTAAALMNQQGIGKDPTLSKTLGRRGALWRVPASCLRVCKVSCPRRNPIIYSREFVFVPVAQIRNRKSQIINLHALPRDQTKIY